MSETLGLSDQERQLWELRQKALDAQTQRLAVGDLSDDISEGVTRISDELETIAHHALSMAETLHELKASKDQAYLERNTLVALLAHLYPSGLRPTTIEGWNPVWNNCCYIDLPTGQVSFHYHDDVAHLFQGLPSYTKPYDGHDKAVALKRIRDAFGYDTLSTANLIGN